MIFIAHEVRGARYYETWAIACVEWFAGGMVSAIENAIVLRRMAEVQWVLAVAALLSGRA